jgi:hypothetical protein
MNGWDYFTYFCSFALALSAVVIFGGFLRDARELLDPESRKADSNDEA